MLPSSDYTCMYRRSDKGSSAIQLTEASYLGPDSPRTSPRNETVKQCRRQMTVANSPVQWPSWTSCRKWWNVVLPSFVRALLWCIDIMSFRELRATALFLVAPHRDECMEHTSRVVDTLLTVEELLFWSNRICTGRAAQMEAKTKFRFGNIVPKQWTLSGFVQHTSANSMYKDDNKISRQQKVLYMNKMLERVPNVF